MAWAAIGLLATALGAGAGDGAGSYVHTWRAPAECGSPAEVEAQAQEFLSRPLRAEELERVRVEAEVVALDAGLRLDIQVSSPLGETRRAVDADDCAAIVEAAGIIIAVALDPLLVAEAMDAPEPEPEPEPEPKPAPKPAPKPEPPPPSSPPRTTLALPIAAQLGFAEAALPTPGAALALALERGWVRGELGLSFLGPTLHRPFPAQPEAGARVWQLAAQLGPCAVPSLGPVDFPVCAIVEAGVARGVGVGLGSPVAVSRAFVGLAGRVSASWELHPRVAVQLGAEAGASLRRPRFAVDELGEVWRAPAALIRARLGLEFRFSNFSGPRRHAIAARAAKR